ncbi:MAG: S41 family peptidase [Planctomycetota bacterium]|nr:MAG: S41 family peptidase [Planctomycetota bacterium]
MSDNRVSRRSRLIASLLTVLISVAWLAPNTAAATDYASATQALQQGVRYERERQWLKALEIYEQSLKRWPEHADLQYGLRRAKTHFAIQQRYTDRSFRRELLTLPKSEALDLLDVVLERVQRNYVKPVSVGSFVAHGTESLYLALTNDHFLRYLPATATRDRIETFRRHLSKTYWNYPLHDRPSARYLVSRIADEAHTMADLPSAMVVMEYVFGGFNALDDYSALLSPDRYADLNALIEGELVGLGVEIKGETGRGLKLIRVLPDSPARESGLRAGEFIVAIDGRDCRQMDTGAAADLLRGRQGTPVRIRVENPQLGTERDVVVVRRRVHVRSIPVARMLDPRNGIAYIRMTAFQRETVRELDAALEDLHRRGMRSLIWDLRGNPGGLLDVAAEVLDRFIDHGVLVHTAGRSPFERQDFQAHAAGTWKIPLVVLIDGHSASASEIVAGAIRDLNRGTLVGRPSYGKWSVQSIYRLGGGLGMRLTTAWFYTPDGHRYPKTGIRPHVLVDAEDELVLDDSLTGLLQDPDIVRSLEILRRDFAQR